MRNAPCLNCERRGCGSYHDECEKYKAFVEEQNILKNKRLEANTKVVPPRPYRSHKVTPIKCHYTCTPFIFPNLKANLISPAFCLSNKLYMFSIADSILFSSSYVINTPFGTNVCLSPKS
jgi:hypothetical protein